MDIRQNDPFSPTGFVIRVSGFRKDGQLQECLEFIDWEDLSDDPGEWGLWEIIGFMIDSCHIVKVQYVSEDAPLTAL